MDEFSQTAIRHDDSPAHWQIVLASLPLGGILIDPERRISYWNAAAEKLFGYPVDEGPGRLSYAAIVAPDARDDIAALLTRTAHGVQTTSSEIENITRAGERIICEWHFTPLHDAAGHAVGLLGIAQDITARKRIEAAQLFLAQHGWTATAEDFFQALARFLANSLAMDYVCIDRLQADHLAAETVAIYFDGKFDDNVTYTLQDTPCGDVVGKTACCFPQAVRQLFPNDAILQEMAAESYVGITLWDSAGNPIGLIAVIGRQPLRDTHQAETILQLVSQRAAGELERRRTESQREAALAALRVNEESFRGYFNMGTVGMCVTSLDKGWIAVNDRLCHMLGYAREELMQLTWAALTHPADLNADVELFKEILAGKREAYQLDKRFIRKDGQIVYTVLYVTCQRRADGTVQHFRVLTKSDLVVEKAVSTPNRGAPRNSAALELN